MGYEWRMYPEKCFTDYGYAYVTIKETSGEKDIIISDMVSTQWHKSITLNKLKKGIYLIEVQAKWFDYQVPDYTLDVFAKDRMYFEGESRDDKEEEEDKEDEDKDKEDEEEEKDKDDEDKEDEEEDKPDNLPGIENYDMRSHMFGGSVGEIV